MRYWLGESCDRAPGAPDDLGARLAAAARSAGPDRPWLALRATVPASTPRCFARRAEIAERGDLVLGPTLTAATISSAACRPCRDLFSAMPWGSGELAETRARLAHLGASGASCRRSSRVETDRGRACREAS